MEILIPSPKWQELYERSFPAVDSSTAQSTASIDVGKKTDNKFPWVGICLMLIVGIAIYNANQKHELYNSRSP